MTQSQLSGFKKVKPIALGRRSKIYFHDEHSVIKIYEKGFPQNEVKQEYHKAKLVFEHGGIKTPRPIELIEEPSLSAIIFEKVATASLMDLMQKRPWRAFSLEKQVARLHTLVHTVHGLKIETQEERYASLIKSTDRLSSEQKTQVLNALRQLDTNSPTLCHGDFHHGNILADAKSYYIIDWMDAFIGNPILDVALTAVNAAVSSAPPHVTKIYRSIYDTLSKVMSLDKLYIKYYCQVAVQHFIKEVLNSAMLVAAAIHVAQCKEKSWERQQTYLLTR